MTFETSKIALFNKEKISFSTENPRKTIKNVIFFTWLESGIIISNCYIFIQITPQEILGGLFISSLHNDHYPQISHSKACKAYK